MKKILAFAFFVMGFLACAFGIGYSAYNGEYVFTASQVVLSVLAFPKWLECFKFLKG